MEEITVKKEHKFRAGTARGNTHAWITEGLDDAAIIQKLVEVHGLTEKGAKNKLRAVKKLIGS